MEKKEKYDKEMLWSVIEPLASIFKAELDSRECSWDSRQGLEEMFSIIYREDEKKVYESFLERIDRFVKLTDYGDHIEYSGGSLFSTLSPEKIKESLDAAIEWTKWYYKSRLDYCDESISYCDLLEKHLYLKSTSLREDQLKKDRETSGKSETLKTKKKLAYLEKIF